MPTEDACAPGRAVDPEDTKRWLAGYARDGGTVLAVRRKPEGEWPSPELVSEDDLSARLARAVP